MKYKFTILVLTFSFLFTSTIFTQNIKEIPTKNNIYSICNVEYSEYNINLIENFVQSGTEKMIVVFSDNNKLVYGRFSAPLTKIYILRQNDNNWSFEYRNENLANTIFGPNYDSEFIGRFGQLYNCQLIKLGNDEYGLVFDRGIYSTIIPYYENTFSGATVIYYELNNYKASFKFDKNSNTKYYDLIVQCKNQQGYDPEWLEGLQEQTSASIIMSDRKLDKYSFSNGSYIRSNPKYNIGETFKVGYFQYKTDKIEFKKDVSNGLNSATASGIFLIVYLTVTNIDRESSTLTNAMFKIYDSDGYEYDTSQDAMIVMILNDQNKIFMLKEFQPKIPKKIIMPFEVPTKNDVYTLEVSGGFGTGEKSNIKLTK